MIIREEMLLLKWGDVRPGTGELSIFSRYEFRLLEKRCSSRGGAGAKRGQGIHPLCPLETASKAS